MTGCASVFLSWGELSGLSLFHSVCSVFPIDRWNYIGIKGLEGYTNTFLNLDWIYLSLGDTVAYHNSVGIPYLDQNITIEDARRHWLKR